MKEWYVREIFCIIRLIDDNTILRKIYTVVKTHHKILNEKGGGTRKEQDKEHDKEYAEQLKQSAKELIDGIGTDTEEEQRLVKFIYGFIRSSFLKSRAGGVSV